MSDIDQWLENMNIHVKTPADRIEELEECNEQLMSKSKQYMKAYDRLRDELIRIRGSIDSVLGESK